MELRHLRYFVAVAEELNFRRAAERLHVSRPALSKQVRALESEIGVRLLDRNTVKVELTRSGEVFLEESRSLLAHADRAVRRALEMHDGHHGELKIGSVGPIATAFLPKALKTFQKRCAGVEISFVEVPPPEQPAAVSKGSLDIAFSYEPDGPDYPDLHRLCVIRSTFAVALSAHHPWKRRRSIPLEDLPKMPLLTIGRDPRSAHRENIERLWIADGLPAPKMRHVESFDSFVNLIAADQGISLLPRSLDLRSNGIVLIPLATLNSDRDFRMWVLWKKPTPSAPVATFVEILKEMFPL